MVDARFIPEGQSVVDLADMQPGMISLISSTGDFIFLNRAYADWLQVNRRDLITQQITDVLPGMIWPIAEGDHQITIKHPDGKPRHIVVRTARHVNGTDFFQFITDVTSEEELRRRGSIIDTIFSLSNEVFIVVDHDGRFETVSPAFARVTGFADDDIIGRLTSDFHHPDDHEKSVEVRMRLTKGEPIIGFENRYRHIEGGYRWMRWTVIPSAGKLFCIGRDVTDEKTREAAFRQTQKMEAVGQLTGGIAHDFNNLLMAISGSLELVTRKLPEDRDPKIDTFIEGAVSSAKRAASLTHRLLAFSRRQSLAPAVVEVNSLVEGMHELIERTIGTGIEVIDQIGDGVWRTYCDAHQLENGLLNLCLNSRDAMPDGGTIIIRTLNVTPDMCPSRGIPVGEYVKIAVQDTGHGMDEDTKRKAFDPFFTTKPVGSGTGLGLSMLYGFVYQSEGYIRIESELGQGTTVMIYLPRTQQNADDAEATVVREIPCEREASILVVDDETVIRSLICEVLSGAGYEVDAAAEANEALAIIAKNPDIDLLVTDVGLPGLNGKQLAEAARKLRPDLPILFITGYAAGITLRQELVLDHSDMLLKPISMDALQAKVAEILSEID